ncbi:MAG TPA: copper amine oxidase N-terminal domain-containing protein [Syntrophomonadaceae bacterium]|nr:copper amine oxidase N-terminal domain-containing protein [Syntrophomonadaceae bacterium]
MFNRSLALIISIIALIGLVMVPAPYISAQEAGETRVFENVDYQKYPYIRVNIDGEQLVFDTNPQIVNGRTLVPMGTIFSTLGLTIHWDEETRTATGTSDDTTISFTIGSDQALVDGQAKTLEVPASIINGRTMIPLRFLSEALGYNVVWVGDSNLILISRSDIEEWRYDGFERVEPYKEYEAKYINGVKTADIRYTGKNHEVKFVTLYSADGRLVPNVADFDIARYGTGWFQQSPFSGRTYWIDLSLVTGPNNNSLFYDPVSFAPLKTGVLSDSNYTGNYVKVNISEQFFDLDTWRSMGAASNPELINIKDKTLTDGMVIKNTDAIFKVTINDQYSGLIPVFDLLGALLQPDNKTVYAVLDKDPRSMFNWSAETWTKLRGETPWAGMTDQMLLVQTLRKADIITPTKTRFSQFELWVYEYEYVDSVFFFDDGILTAMW